MTTHFSGISFIALRKSIKKPIKNHRALQPVISPYTLFKKERLGDLRGCKDPSPLREEGEAINSRQIHFVNKRTPSPQSPPIKGGEKKGKIPIKPVEAWM